jgi:hypothetical protein
MKARYRERADEVFQQQNASFRRRYALLSRADADYRRNDLEMARDAKRQAQQLMELAGGQQ